MFSPSIALAVLLVLTFSPIQGEQDPIMALFAQLGLQRDIDLIVGKPLRAIVRNSPSDGPTEEDRIAQKKCYDGCTITRGFSAPYCRIQCDFDFIDITTTTMDPSNSTLDL